jgi:hypothetical protein
VNALVFLGIAAGLSAAGCLVLWLRSRQPGSMDAHIRDFARELDALAPGPTPDRSRRSGPRRDPRTWPERLPDEGAGPERPERPKLPPGRGPGPEWPPERGRGPEWPPERGTDSGTRPRAG